jgi:UDP-N-acetylglucosamine 2-epimerase (non-hydrolysing)
MAENYMSLHLLHIVGARPNFMKAAPTYAALAQHDSVRQTVVHTGQHYDYKMSGVFFDQLGMPAPEVNLAVGSASHAAQTAEIMVRAEQMLLKHKPDLVLVYGDVNSTIAVALVCAKIAIPVAHVEAGLRSFDRSMPEEVNRVLTDQISDLLFTPSIDGNENLLREGIAPERIHLVGNVMIDTLVRLSPYAADHIPVDLPERYGLVTLHRPANVDDLPWLEGMLAALAEVSRELTVVFPVHPRTRQRMAQLGSSALAGGRVRFMEPLPYLEFLAAQQRATVVVTDSGGIQEETTFLGVPCLTVRDNTERPVTITHGTNTLVGRDFGKLRRELARILEGRHSNGKVPPLWDGHAAERIAALIVGKQRHVATA